MARTRDSLLEIETIIIFNETDDPAKLWTASPKVRKEWESYGFHVVKRYSGWGADVPKDRISYKTLQKQAQK